jgi:hypothetical protein
VVPDEAIRQTTHVYGWSRRHVLLLDHHRLSHLAPTERQPGLGAIRPLHRVVVFILALGWSYW